MYSFYPFPSSPCCVCMIDTVFLQFWFVIKPHTGGATDEIAFPLFREGVAFACWALTSTFCFHLFVMLEGAVPLGE